MLRRAFFVLLACAVAGVAGSAAPGLFTSQALAQSTPTPIPFSCFFAGFNQFNNLINSGIACATPGSGGGGGTTVVIPSPPITVVKTTSSPNTYQVGLSIGNCLGVSAGALAYTCPTPLSTPSPSATSTGCGTLSWTGSWPYTISGNFVSCGGGAAVTVTGSPPVVVTTPGGAGQYQVSCASCAGFVILSTPNPTPSPLVTLSPPNDGSVALTGQVQAHGYVFNKPDTAGNFWLISPQKDNTTTECSEGYGLCFFYGSSTPNQAYYFGGPQNQNYKFQIGLANTSNAGVLCSSRSADNDWSCMASSQGISGATCWHTGVFFNLGTPLWNMCLQSGDPSFIFDTNGRFHALEGVYSGGIVTVPRPTASPVTNPSPGDAWFSEGNTSGRMCLGGNNGTASSGCWDYGLTLSGALTGSAPVKLTSTDNKGQIVCTISSGTACNGSATILSGAVCAASYDHTATTITPLTDLLPLQVATSGTTLTVYMDTSASLSGNLAADYTCL